VNELAGIYIHIPFCERKCVYCNFNTTDYNAALAARYVPAVVEEIRYWGGLVADHSRPAGPRVQLPLASPNKAGAPGKLPIDSVFFGGGTPSTLTSDQLAAIIDACDQAFELLPGAEITVEINPSRSYAGSISEWRLAGINRASIGVQSFIDRELEALSRTHTADDARRTFQGLREGGFENISLDLIAGLPDQTRSDWEFNLDQALGMEPEHLSLYLLEVKEGTQLYSQIERGRRSRPDDDLAAEMYEIICDRAAEAGYEHYEISNFALAPRGVRAAAGPSVYRSRHNMKYWTGASFYGAGCGAHSYDGISRWVNIKQTEKYIDSISRTGQAIAERTDLSRDDRAAEALFMGLRLIDGVDLAEFESRYGVDVRARYGSELDRMSDAGLIESAGSRLKLTARGLVLSNEVFVAFV
jgi:oxygen-independent coproporphyrinogen-3 oxidase